MMPESLA